MDSRQRRLGNAGGRTIAAVSEPSLPLTGGCGCGAVRFEITAPLVSAVYCHCTRCQRRSGAGAVLVGEERTRLALDPEHAVRVGPGTSRVLASGPAGLRVLIVGGVPGEAYVAPEWSSG